MKILVLQIAKPADNLKAWPALRALRRTQPDAKIHILTTPEMVEALRRWNVADRVHVLPSVENIEEVLKNVPADREAAVSMSTWTENLRQENFDRVINLSFSVISSWITSMVASPHSALQGYSRHADGWLHVADDVSSFIFAQAGAERANRVHLSDLFASLVDVDLIEDDWKTDAYAVPALGLPEKYVVLSVSAWISRKMPGFLLARVLKHFSDATLGTTIVLTGGVEENRLAEEIRSQAPNAQIVDLTGKISLKELFGVVAHARVLIGTDDAAVQIASLTGTRTLALGLTGSNFWESGPKAEGSVVIPVSNENFSSEEIGRAMAQMLVGETPSQAILHQGGVPAYIQPPQLPQRRLFAWEMIQALYLNGEFPVVNDLEFVQAVEKLREMNNVVMEQLQNLPLESAHLGSLMDRADEVMDAVVKVVADSGVLVRWVKTQKSRIPPCTRTEVRQAMREIHRQFGDVLNLYSFDAAEEKVKSGG